MGQETPLQQQAGPKHSKHHMKRGACRTCTWKSPGEGLLQDLRERQVGQPQLLQGTQHQGAHAQHVTQRSALALQVVGAACYASWLEQTASCYGWG